MPIIKEYIPHGLSKTECRPSLQEIVPAFSAIKTDLNLKCNINYLHVYIPQIHFKHASKFKSLRSRLISPQHINSLHCICIYCYAMLN